MDSGQLPTVSSTYQGQQLQQTGPDNTQHQSNSIFFESEIRKGSEIVMSQSQLGAIQHGVVTTSQIKTETDIQPQQSQQSVFYSGQSKEISPNPDGRQQYTNVSEVTSCSSETRYPEISQASQVASSSAVDIDLSHSDTLEQLSNELSRPVQSDKTHICLTCGKAFRNKPQLTQHELVHNGIRKHVCSYCEKAFKQICHLNQHIRVHTGERPYKCSIEGCGRAFAQLSNLNHHQKNHEEHVRRDVLRQYRCEVCDRSYANHNSLQTHIMKLHSSVREGGGPVLQGLSPPNTKKRKKSATTTSSEASRSITAVSESGDTFILNFSDTEADGLPSQVRTKSSLSLNAVSNPALFGQSNVKCESSVVAGAQMSLPALYQRSTLPTMSEEFQNSPKTTVGNLKLELQMGTVMSDRLNQIEEATHLEKVASGEETVSSAYLQRELSQIHTQQKLQNYPSPQSRELIQCSTPSSSDLPSLQLYHQSRLLQQGNQGIVDRSSPSVSQQLSQRSSPLVTQESQQPLNPRAEAPSHITHHYPEPEARSKVSRPQVFNPAFSDNTGRYSQSQF